MACILLVDNGSVRPEATLRLRTLAHALGEETGDKVYPVSLQHSDKIDKANLNGEPAQVFSVFMNWQLTEGEREFIVLPLFFGVSRALTSYIPEQVRELRKTHNNFRLHVADVLYPLPEGEPLLADILYDHVRRTAKQAAVALRNIILVDHGSPIPQVTQVRQGLAGQLADLLGDGVVIEQAVMERRSGKSYDFNGELLEALLTRQAKQGESGAIVALLFLLPGRHAGEGGDIEAISERVMSQYPGFDILLTPLVSEHESLLTILKSRLQAVELSR